MLNPNKKNWAYIISIFFQCGLSNAAFQLFFASYKLIIYADYIHAIDNYKDEKCFMMQYPLLIIVTLSANRFPLFSFLGTVFDNALGFRK